MLVINFCDLVDDVPCALTSLIHHVGGQRSHAITVHVAGVGLGMRLTYSGMCTGMLNMRVLVDQPV